jgi:hypothetical protein
MRNEVDGSRRARWYGKPPVVSEDDRKVVIELMEERGNVGRAQMMDDDLVSADLVQNELHSARTEPNDKALDIIRYLVNMTEKKGNRSPEIENARGAVWLELCAIRETLKTGQNPFDQQWDNTTYRTKHWKSLLVRDESSREMIRQERT